MAGDTGKRVFLLNPPSVVAAELIEALLAAEYEVYLLKDPDRAKRVFARFNDSIVWVGIDSVLGEQQWQDYVRSLLAQKAGDLKVGVLSYNADASLAERYLMQIGVQCGFVALKLGVEESTRIMLRALDANEARGRRRYVRARTADDDRTSFNLTINGQHVTGRILDISSVGMAVRFRETFDLPSKSVLRNIQLKLRATLVGVDGVVIGTRSDDPAIRVILFQYTKGDDRPRHRIRQYIHQTLQEAIERVENQP
ncbi:MAG: PilZ domain-containing protein [Spirochaetaceae bacterium]|nr:MAG: PilZ domain-containing protein [Spirochaetaceae bacterium]